ncbi:MAG TPA: GNAT family N-acetyltransferase, partial [Lysobacter sp.]
WLKKGLATLLMKHVIEVARANGIRRMTAVDRAGNVQMKELTTALGFHTRMDPDDACQVLHEIEL